jgi:uncharacterized protein YciI
MTDRAREQCWIIRGIQSDNVPPDVDVALLRERHTAFLDELDAEGLLVVHGACRDEHGHRSGAGLILIRAETRARAEAIAQSEPYIQNGVWTFELVPWQIQRSKSL